MVHVHVIPVPSGMAPEEAWAEILIMGKLTEPSPGGTWASIRCDGQECEGIEVDR